MYIGNHETLLTNLSNLSGARRVADGADHIVLIALGPRLQDALTVDTRWGQPP